MWPNRIHHHQRGRTLFSLEIFLPSFCIRPSETFYLKLPFQKQNHLVDDYISLSKFLPILSAIPSLSINGCLISRVSLCLRIQKCRIRTTLVWGTGFDGKYRCVPSSSSYQLW
ncbi:hypothetical protein L1049_012585 [Liquidambar formosana]|uniref:Uncharacterized protein n=1 Tax=Liquidambar formosana TaxID=63359 RepID=A0AAP0R496_LIQFO